MFSPAFFALCYAVLVRNERIAGAVYYVSKTLTALLPLVWLWAVARQKVAFPRPRRVGLATGTAFGIAVAAVMLVSYYLVFKGRIDAAGVRQKFEVFADRSNYVVFALFLAVANSAFEEYYWRWFVFGRLKEHVSPAAAIVISATAFSLHHLVVLLGFFKPVWVAWLMIAGVWAGGAAWAWLYHRFANYYAPWISHLIIDAAAMAVGYDLLLLS